MIPEDLPRSSKECSSEWTYFTLSCAHVQDLQVSAPSSSSSSQSVKDWQGIKRMYGSASAVAYSKALKSFAVSKWAVVAGVR